MRRSHNLDWNSAPGGGAAIDGLPGRGLAAASWAAHTYPFISGAVADGRERGSLGWMKRIQDKWLMIAAAIAVALMLANVWLTYNNARELREHGDRVDHSYQVVGSLQSLMARLVDAETGQRGYLITFEDRYLDPYHDALPQIDAEIENIQRLTADNETQQSRMATLRQRVDDRLKTLESNVTLRRDQSFDAAREAIATDRGKTQMDAVRRLVGEMLKDERALLKVRSAEADATYRRSIATDLLSGLSALAAVGVLLASVRQNLTARARAAARLAEQRELLQTTLSSIGDAVVTTDLDARVTYLNPVAQQLTGWSQVDARGQPLDVVFNIVNESTRHPVDNPAHRALREGVIVGLANHTVLLAKDGVERPIDDSAAPIRDQTGHIAGCVLVFRDVSDRRDAETSIRESESKYRTLVEQVKDYAIFRIDPEGRPTTWNAGVQSVLGFTEEEFVGKDLASLIFTPEDQAAGVPQHELELAADKGSVSGDRWMIKKDGTRFWAAGVTESLRDHQGRLIGYTKVKRDRTDAKLMEDDLRQFAAELSEADRRKNEFLAMLAHELRNPLAPIRNSLEILHRSQGSADQTAEATAMMQRQVSQMVRLIDDLLDVSRVSRGAIELRKGQVDLVSIVNDALSAAQALAQCQSVDLVAVAPGEAMYVEADAARLSQIIGNLLSNACKFTNAGGSVRLELSRDQNEAVVRIVDTGVGIAAEQLPRIFDMFMQADTSLERAQSGLGIGLTLVKRLTEMHGGSIEAFSAGLGQGSEFVVRLPLSRAPASTAPSPSNGGATTVAGRRILVVDDNRDSAQSLAMLLKLSKNEVEQAHDGEAALAAAGQLRPDAILLDIGLPKLNGYEVARRIRSQPWGADVVLVALTGWGQDEDRRQSQEAGFNGHLVKPVDHAALMKLLADSLPPD